MTDSTSHPGSAWHGALSAASRHAYNYLDGLPAGRVGPIVGAEELRMRLRKPLPSAPMNPETVIDELNQAVGGGLMNSGSARFYGWVIGGSLPAAMAADWLTAAWDQNAASYSTSPAAGMVEEVAGEWLKELLGLPSTASFALVTGCQMAHFTCLAAARHAVLVRQNWNVETSGLCGAPLVKIVTSDLLHGSAERAIRMLGFGTDQILKIPSDAMGKLSPAAVDQALGGHSGPAIVILQAGDLCLGAFDSFAELVPIAHRHGAWVHVDGAFGLWCAASDKYRTLLDGVSGADSWATDGHKWLNVSHDCGYAIVADRAAHQAAMSYRASYIDYSTDVRDPADWNPEWSRRARGFCTYAAIRELGQAGIAEMIERGCEVAKALSAAMGALPGVEIVNVPQINQGLVRFPSLKLGATQADHDRRTNEIVELICASGDAYFSGTTWRGQRALRISVCNWQSHQGDVPRVIGAVRQALARASAA